MICVREGWKFRTSNPIVINQVVEALGRYNVEAALRGKIVEVQPEMIRRGKHLEFF